MRILFTGGRHYTDRVKVRCVLERAVAKWGRFVAVHGACRGADALVEEVALELGLEVERHPADFYPDGRTLDRSAGPRRNAAMVATAPDVCIAFPGDKGMRGYIALARAAAIETFAIGVTPPTASPAAPPAPTSG